jgi:hypothetical protein
MPRIVPLAQEAEVLAGKVGLSQARRPGRCQLLEPAAVDYIRAETVMGAAAEEPGTSELEAVAVPALASLGTQRPPRIKAQTEAKGYLTLEEPEITLARRGTGQVRALHL